MGGAFVCVPEEQHNIEEAHVDGTYVRLHSRKVTEHVHKRDGAVIPKRRMKKQFVMP